MAGESDEAGFGFGEGDQHHRIVVGHIGVGVEVGVEKFVVVEFFDAGVGFGVFEDGDGAFHFWIG